MSIGVQQQRITVLGLGYVGCVTAACLARLGHTVTGVDSDGYKVEQVNAGRAPFYEPGLEDVVRSETAAGRLRATTSLAEGMAGARIAMICVGTPSERNGDLSLGQLDRVSREIAEVVAATSAPLVVAVRSTVFPGTCESVVVPRFAGNPAVSVVSNPEFLREGSAINDFMEPSLVVVGGEDRGAVETVASLYAPLNAPACLVSLRTAEMIKYSCNAFHALKIAFANEMGALSNRMGVSGAEVMATLTTDVKLNASAAYLKPGFAFGGSCLPKDLRALTYRASRLDLKLPLLESVIPSNDQHLSRALEEILDLPCGRLGVFGLAFKENTDDLRESPVVTMIERLIGKGRELRIYDPHIRLDSIYGSNRRFVLEAIPHIGKLMLPSLGELLEWSEHIVVTQKASSDMAAVIRGFGKPVLNLSPV